MNQVCKVVKWCPICNKRTGIMVDAERYCQWQEGGLIQNVFPELPIQERETLISGLCANCQKKFF